jgi:hypothetical protein
VDHIWSHAVRDVHPCNWELFGTLAILIPGSNLP